MASRISIREYKVYTREVHQAQSPPGHYIVRNNASINYLCQKMCQLDGI